MYINRLISNQLEEWLKGTKSLLLWGPRQTGKTTLIEEWLLPKLKQKGEVAIYPLQKPDLRQRLEADIGSFQREVEALSTPAFIVVDEVQKVPPLMDGIQYLIDHHKGKYRFVLTGSSARKLRRLGGNLLPGRVIEKRLDPFSWRELFEKRERHFLFDGLPSQKRSGPSYSLNEMLLWGTLPEIPFLKKPERNDVLRSYVSLYLEQEIRAEAVTRNLGAFSRFLELAALESGSAPNLTKLSNLSGVEIKTIKEYFLILEDTFLIETLGPFTSRSRKNIFMTPRYFFFDTGVRNACAKVPLMEEMLQTEKGRLFEHLVILEILRTIRIFSLPWKTFFWRTKNDAEVDLVVETPKEIIPVEIKAQPRVHLSAIKGLKSFLNRYGAEVKKALVVALVERPQKLEDKIWVIPWNYL